MATKTISIDLEAYGRMSAARKYPRESFSQVIHRAVWLDHANPSFLKFARILLFRLIPTDFRALGSHKSLIINKSIFKKPKCSA